MWDSAEFWALVAIWLWMVATWVEGRAGRLEGDLVRLTSAVLAVWALHLAWVG